MPTRPKTKTRDVPAPGGSEHDDSDSVEAFLRTLQHPLKPVIASLRAAILSADQSISEGIKWNTASFYRSGWFATINVRAKSGVQVVLHHGAKVREDAALTQMISDPAHLLTWLAKDRATITFADAEDFRAKEPAFKKVVSQWAGQQAAASDA